MAEQRMTVRPADGRPLGNPVHQCLKCWHMWKLGEHVRRDGRERTRCPKCNSPQTMVTRLNPTRIVVREDLLMFTSGQYPHKYCPRTSAEELFGRQGYILNRDGVKIMISRGLGDKEFGHYVYLIVDGKLWMTTSAEEHESMERAVQQCPENARAFIAGLGLGLVLLKLARSGKAREVLVVERDRRVISAVEPIIRAWFEAHYPSFNWRVICGDALEEVERHGKWDWIFFDIWSDAGASRRDEPRPEEVRVRAERFLTDRGRLTLWTDVVNEMSRPKLEVDIDRLLDALIGGGGNGRS